jgi:3-oxoadipate enol-lactonase
VARNRYARIGGVRIAYELRGRLRRRRPWLVLIQGLGFDRTGWDPVARQLKRQFRLVLIDNRGSGRSTVPTDSFTVGHMAADVARVLDAARIPRAHVVGHSLGGMVAQELAVDYPERVEQLVLAGTTPGWPYAYGMPAGSVKLMAETPRLPGATAVRRHVENSLSARTVEERPDLVERLVRHQLSHPSDPAAWAALAAAGASYTGALRQTRIQAPTLVLHGSADDVVDPRNGALLAARIPRARLVMLPDLGHLFFWENPEAFVEAVATFLLERGSDDQLDTP